MNGFRLLCALSVFLFSAGLPLLAQTASDPNDRMYSDLKLWEDRGLVASLPQLRPYPIQLLKKLLADVQDKGNPDDAARAHDYLAAMEGVIDIHVGAGLETRTNAKDVYSQITFGGPFQGSLDPLVTYSGYLAGVANNAVGSAVLPEYGRSTVDYITDGGVHPIRGFTPRVSSATAAAIGSDTFYFQAGDIRGSWGPFWGDSAVLSPLSPQSGQFAIVYRGERFTVSEAVMAISAVRSGGTGGPFADKYLALHGLDLYPFPWLTLGIFESVVWGGRFEPLYLLPFAVHYYTQGLISFPDNSFIGVNGSIRLPQSLRLDFLAYFDDMSFNDIIRLNLNTRMKFAFQAGVTWTPDLPLLSSLGFEALMVTPYTYTHQDSTDANLPNFQDYTNDGQNIGPSLQPDSLRLQVSALLRPMPTLDVRPFLRMILHGNASTNASPADPSGTGTIFDNGYYGPSGTEYEAFNTFRFLDQAVIEKTFQLGADAAIYLRTSAGQVKVYGSYTIEYIRDPIDGSGQRAGSSALNNYLGIGVAYLY